jgi:hypothetical protein
VKTLRYVLGALATPFVGLWTGMKVAWELLKNAKHSHGDDA